MANLMIPRVLTIAGSDSGGGAGIQADIKTFTALKVFGMSVITSITAQNTTGVSGIQDLPTKMIAQQFEAVAKDIGVDAAKTGMLSNEKIINVVARKIKQFRINQLVVDPVMRAKSGDALLRPAAQKALIKKIIPLALVVTPNIPEAEALTGREINSTEDMKQAALQIAAQGPRYVLIKGGHSNDGRSMDLLYDRTKFHFFVGKRYNTKNTHGTGCTLSAAIAAYLALGNEVPSAVRLAKNFVTGAISQSFALGKGHGPLNHFWNL
jgi:hydroxymethylpyrimidine/phosphomethylpyrimidine kinase